MSYLFKTEHYEMVLKSGDMENCLKKIDVANSEVPKKLANHIQIIMLVN